MFFVQWYLCQISFIVYIRQMHKKQWKYVIEKQGQSFNLKTFEMLKGNLVWSLCIEV